jgi:hypothetical protein
MLDTLPFVLHLKMLTGLMRLKPLDLYAGCTISAAAIEWEHRVESLLVEGENRTISYKRLRFSGQPDTTPMPQTLAMA